MRRALLLALALCGGGRAIGFSLAPTVLEIDPDRRLTAETRLVNTDTAALTFTVEVLKWENVDGQDVYTPTRDVLVNPERFTLAPLGKQVIRVGLQKRVGSGELTYRVFIRQQPGTDAPAAGDPGVDGAAPSFKTLLNISLPIYAASASSAPKLVYTPVVQGDALHLTIHNAGTRHFTFRQLSIVSETGLSFGLPSKALLAGGSVTLLLPGFAGARQLKMTSYDAQGQALYDQLTLP